MTPAAQLGGTPTSTSDVSASITSLSVDNIFSYERTYVAASQVHQLNVSADGGYDTNFTTVDYTGERARGACPTNVGATVKPHTPLVVITQPVSLALNLVMGCSKIFFFPSLF